MLLDDCESRGVCDAGGKESQEMPHAWSSPGCCQTVSREKYCAGHDEKASMNIYLWKIAVPESAVIPCAAIDFGHNAS